MQVFSVHILNFHVIHEISQCNIEHFIDLVCIDNGWFYILVRFKTMQNNIFQRFTQGDFFRTLFYLSITHFGFEVMNGGFTDTSFPKVIARII